jgi:hypothetical protein
VSLEVSLDSVEVSLDLVVSELGGTGGISKLEVVESSEEDVVLSTELLVVGGLENVVAGLASPATVDAQPARTMAGTVNKATSSRRLLIMETISLRCSPSPSGMRPSGSCRLARFPTECYRSRLDCTGDLATEGSTP